MENILALFEKAEQFVRANGFGDEIDWCDNRPTFDQIDAQKFLTEYAWVVLNSGMSNRVIAEKWPKISAAFFNFEISKIADNEEEALTKALAIFGNKAKMKAILSLALRLYDRGFPSIKTRITNNPLNFLQTLPFIGDITKYHLARNLGFDYIKPDRHLVRLASRFNMKPFDFCNLIHQKTRRRLGTIDVILWRYSEQKGQMKLKREIE